MIQLPTLTDFFLTVQRRSIGWSKIATKTKKTKKQSTDRMLIPNFLYQGFWINNPLIFYATSINNSNFLTSRVFLHLVSLSFDIWWVYLFTSWEFFFLHLMIFRHLVSFSFYILWFFSKHLVSLSFYIWWVFFLHLMIFYVFYVNKQFT